MLKISSGFDILYWSSVRSHCMDLGGVVVKSLEIFEKFPTRKDCIEYLEKIRWVGDPMCPYCGSDHNVPTQDRHHCYTCRTSFSVTVGTIFHRTHLPLQTWFLALRLMLKDKKGISALQLSRDLRINKNTAWRIHMKIRKAMTHPAQRSLLTCIVEMDETNWGGHPGRGIRESHPPGSNSGGRGTDKTPVTDASDRQGNGHLPGQ